MNQAVNQRWMAFTTRIANWNKKHDMDMKDRAEALLKPCCHIPEIYRRNMVGLVSYFQLNNSNLSITLNRDMERNCCVLTVKYMVEQPMLELSNLPLELSKHIFSYYSHECVQLKYTISFPEFYPFEPPKWSLDTIQSSASVCPSTTFLRDYYQDIVELHNEQYRRDVSIGNPVCVGQRVPDVSEMSPERQERWAEHYYWSPAITIETDVLKFITRIYHFDYVFHNDDDNHLPLDYGYAIKN